MRTFMQFFVSVVAGAVSVFAFAPYNYWAVPYLTLAWLFYCWANANPKAAFFHGLAFGTALFIVGTSWVYNSLSVYGGMPLWMGSIAVLGFSLLLGFFTAACGLVLALLVPKENQSRILFIPIFWVVFEWLKSWVLTGFPWLDFGYSQTDTVLFHLAPVAGLYLVSFAVSCVAVALLTTALALWQRRYRTLAWSSVVALLIVSVSGYLGTVEWGSTVGKPLTVGVVQPNTPIENKWGPAYRNQVLNRLENATRQITSQGDVDLVIWPETALPALLSQTNDEFWTRVRPEGTALLTGIVDREMNTGEIADYNAAILVCDSGSGVYRKRHLVPFGEYLPLRFLFQWVLDYLQLPMSDFASWQDVQNLECGQELKIGLSICYEDAFSGEHRKHTQAATMLVNISEDAWFGDSLAPHQRLQMAQMRAKELALPLVRSANSGPSVFINEHGRIEQQSAQFEGATLTAVVQPRSGATTFRIYGEWVVYLSLLLIAYQSVRRFRQSRS